MRAPSFWSRSSLRIDIEISNPRRIGVELKGRVEGIEHGVENLRVENRSTQLASLTLYDQRLPNDDQNRISNTEHQPVIVSETIQGRDSICRARNC